MICSTWSATNRPPGKSLGTDLEKRKPTLPLIRVYQLATDPERREWVALLEGGGPDLRRQVNLWLERCDALAYARQKAVEFAIQAREQLQGLPPSPAKTVLLEPDRIRGQPQPLNGTETYVTSLSRLAP